MYVGGEIADLRRIGRPQIGVVTAVQPVHLSRIGTIEAVEPAKGELVEALPADGVAILNADDERVRRMAAPDAARVLTYGFAADADVRAERVDVARRRRDALRPRDPSRPPAGRRSRRSAGSRSTTPWPPRRSGSPPGSTLDDDRRRPGRRLGARRTAASSIRPAA